MFFVIFLYKPFLSYHNRHQETSIRRPNNKKNEKNLLQKNRRILNSDILYIEDDIL